MNHPGQTTFWKQTSSTRNYTNENKINTWPKAIYFYHMKPNYNYTLLPGLTSTLTSICHLAYLRSFSYPGCTRRPSLHSESGPQWCSGPKSHQTPSSSAASPVTWCHRLHPRPVAWCDLMSCGTRCRVKRCMVSDPWRRTRSPRQSQLTSWTFPPRPGSGCHRWSWSFSWSFPLGWWRTDHWNQFCPWPGDPVRSQLTGHTERNDWASCVTITNTYLA